jgi:hypothetical protein
LKFNLVFARLTRGDPKFARLSNFNPEARELFDPGVVGAECGPDTDQ